jgi:hypothetical protein
MTVCLRLIVAMTSVGRRCTGGHYRCVEGVPADVAFDPPLGTMRVPLQGSGVFCNDEA